ncbi:MAG: helix-turn-helix domain-containing protein [Desulfurococcales archaeon]|nr:helix-turn-helix domain-containing protein [Desulfurococcales archaeon]
MIKDAATKELLYQTLAVLYKHAEQLVVLEYPKSIERRSVDLVVKFRNGKKLLVKVAYDADSLPRSEIQELHNLSSVLEVPAIIVSVYRSDTPLIDGVAYERGGVRIVTPETLNNILSGKEQIYIYEGKDCFKLSIDGRKLKEKRLEKNMSLGDLALLVGVSRRAIYEYEKGNMEPSIEKGEKLIKVLGEDIVKPVNIFKPVRRHPRTSSLMFDTETEQKIANALLSKGYSIAHAKRTVVDLTARKGSEDKITVLVEHPRESSHRIIEKIYYLNRMADTVDVEERYVIVEKKKVAQELRKEGILAYNSWEFMRMVAESGQRKKNDDDET